MGARIEGGIIKSQNDQIPRLILCRLQRSQTQANTCCQGIGVEDVAHAGGEEGEDCVFGAGKGDVC